MKKKIVFFLLLFLVFFLPSLVLAQIPNEGFIYRAALRPDGSIPMTGCLEMESGEFFCNDTDEVFTFKDDDGTTPYLKLSLDKVEGGTNGEYIDFSTDGVICKEADGGNGLRTCWVQDTSVDLDSLIASDTDMDVMILGSGTWTLIDDIDVDRTLSIIGQGRDNTILQSATGNKNLLDLSLTVGEIVTIQNLTVDYDAVGIGIKVSNSGKAVLNNIDVSVVTSAGGNARPVFVAEDSAITIIDSNIYGEGPYTTVAAIWLDHTNAATADSTSYIYNSVLHGYNTDSGADDVGCGIYLRDSSSTKDKIVYIYNSYLEGSDGGGSAESYGALATAGDDFIYAFNSRFLGDSSDITNTAGTVTLDDCSLASGTMSGTIAVSNSHVSDKYYGADADTFIDMAADQIDVKAGGVTIANFVEGTQDVFQITSSAFLRFQAPATYDIDCSDEPTCADDSTPATDTLTPTATFMHLICSDPNSTDVSMDKTNMVDGTIVFLTNDGAEDCDFSDSDGVSNLNGNFSLSDDDLLVLLYSVDEWLALTLINNTP